jgi:hypothetical protein
MGSSLLQLQLTGGFTPVLPVSGRRRQTVYPFSARAAVIVS